jgi:hypothetical protein
MGSVKPAVLPVPVCGGHQVAAGEHDGNRLPAWIGVGSV